MANAPYFLDFLLNNIVDVHFGSPWVALVGTDSNLFGGHVKVTFPGIAGGTPGFTLVLEQVPITTVTRVVLKPTTSQPLHTDAGAAMTGFKLGDPADPFMGAVFLQCTGVLASKFAVHFDAEFGHGPDWAAYLFSSDFFSLGKVVNASAIEFFPANPFPWVKQTRTSHGFPDVTIDPVKFTVEGH